MTDETPVIHLGSTGEEVKYLGDKPRGFPVWDRTAPAREFNSLRPSPTSRVGWN
jgi:hypothetical protein